MSLQCLPFAAHIILLPRQSLQGTSQSLLLVRLSIPWLLLRLAPLLLLLLLLERRPALLCQCYDPLFQVLLFDQLRRDGLHVKQGGKRKKEGRNWESDAAF